MNQKDIIQLRLHNHHLTGSLFKTPAEYVGHMGAVQSQDYHAAKWSVGLRVTGATDKSVEEAYNKGEILRTHIMRPTWHFVLPKTIRWMETLTSPRVIALNKTMGKKLELTDEIYSRSADVIAKALHGHNYLTREELGSELAKHTLPSRGQHLAYVVMYAELTGLICSGPRKGKQFSYALLEERAPNALVLPYEEALATLTETYYTSHGPAQLRDFAWWSGLTLKEAQLGLEMVKGKLEQADVGGKTYWFAPQKIQYTEHNAFLLSIYDEFTIAYNDRTDISEKKDIERMIKLGNALTAVVVVNGAVAGTWKRTLSKKQVTITVDLFRPLTKEDMELLQHTAQKYGAFHELPVELVTKQS